MNTNAKLNIFFKSAQVITNYADWIAKLKMRI